MAYFGDFDSLHLPWHGLVEAWVVRSYTITDLKQPMLFWVLWAKFFTEYEK
jgi:hypothetical protein